LPSGFKTSEERMSDINRGLNRLGLSLYTQKEPFERFQEELPKDEDEQVDDIIAQAQDEAALEEKTGVLAGSKTAASQDDDNDDEDTASDDEESEEDLLLDDDQLAIKKIRRKVANAQVKLAKLLAFLDEAKAAKQEEDEEKDIKGDDESSDDDIEKPDSTAYLASGKKSLKGAQKDLKKALGEWIEGLL
jgi:hypothetical protein